MYPDFESIPKFPFANHRETVFWSRIEKWIELHNQDIGVDLNPTYQRGYVWSEYQKRAYIEYRLRGGISGRDIYWNSVGWGSLCGDFGPLELVDGKQRLDAVIGFLNNKVRAFGMYCSQFNGPISNDLFFICHVNNLKNRKDLIEWYIGMNTGGSIHTKDDLMPAYTELTKLILNENNH